MAEQGAHLASAVATQDGAPSVFEALAQDGLVSAVRPALRHACKVLAESSPAVFGPAWRRFDELYLLLDFLLQRHSLLRHSASFSENFYDLKRVAECPAAMAAKATGPRLPRRQFWLSLALLVAAPYLRLKLERLVARIRDEMDCGIHLPHSRSVRLYRAFLAAYPFACMSWEGMCLWHQVAYALGRGRHHSPLLRLAGVRLASREPGDHGDDGARSPRPPHGGVLGALGSLASGAAVNISAAFSVTVFFLQFLESFYALRDAGSGLLGGGGGGGGGGGASSLLPPDLPTPPPPVHLHADAELPAGACPLCHRRRTNDTALATSGVVLCYPCAYGFVRERGRCPVTGYPTGTKQLVRLYPPDQ